MEELLKTVPELLSWPVILYLTIVVLAFFVPEKWFQRQRRKIAQQRQKAGLPPDSIMNAAEKLSQIRFEAKTQSVVFILAVIVTPLVIATLIPYIDSQPDHHSSKQALALAFLGMLIWSLTTGTDVAKAFLGGLSFKTLVAFSKPIQVGDRVKLQNYSGKVLSIGTFFVTLQTGSDDLVSIPTRDLWSSVLVSVNAGERSSLCVMEFYLGQMANQEQRQQAEDIIWDAIQASPYFEISKPMQIYLSQVPGALKLTAKAYVASTYNEGLFSSDVNTAFLNGASEKGLPLAGYPVREPVL